MALFSLCILRLLLCSFPGSRSDPTIRAEPGPVIAQGSSVTIVCSTSVEYSKVRLEKDGSTFMIKNTGPNVREDRFLIGPVDETFTGRYSCIYANENIWSQRSENLELWVIKESVTQVPDTQVSVTQFPDTQVPAPGPTVTSGLFLEAWILTVAGTPCLHLLCFFLTPKLLSLNPLITVPLTVNDLDTGTA